MSLSEVTSVFNLSIGDTFRFANSNSNKWYMVTNKKGTTFKTAQLGYTALGDNKEYWTNDFTKKVVVDRPTDGGRKIAERLMSSLRRYAYVEYTPKNQRR